MKFLLTGLLLILMLSVYSQDLTGSELLDRTIAYHDPNKSWSTLAAKMTFAPEERGGKTINRTVEFKNGGNYFRSYRHDGENETEQLVNNGKCTFTLNGASEISDEDKEKHRLTCDRATMMKNYYTYLYGLPMKLKDEGTIVDEQITKEQFMGTEYLKLRVTYDAAVGKDIWYFYINPMTYEMSVYQFYHDETKGDGEYITLEGTIEIAGIKIPKLRTWYTNKEDKVLGVDNLAKIEKLK